MCKKQNLIYNNGSAYIYTIIIFMFASLILNYTIGSLKVKDEFKRNQNNNLYYIAKSGSDTFLDILNKILILSTKQAKESDKSDIQIFNENMRKYLYNRSFSLLETICQPYHYEIKINNLEQLDVINLVYSLELRAINKSNNNEVKLACKYKRDGDEFMVVYNKLSLND